MSDQEEVVSTVDKVESPLDRFYKEVEGSPGKLFSEFSNFTNDEIESLSLEEHLKFLRVMEAAAAVDDTQFIKKHFDVVINRFEKDVTDGNVRDGVSWYDVMDIGEKTRVLIWEMTHQDENVLTPTQLDRLYNFVHSDEPKQRHHALEYMGDLIRLDNRRKNEDGFLGIQGRFESELAANLATPAIESDVEDGYHMVEVVWAEYPGALPRLLIESLNKANSDESIRRVFSIFANRTGLSVARDVIRDEAKNNPDFVRKFELVEKAIKFEPLTEINLVDLYRKIQKDFREYKPNKDLNELEVGILAKEFKGKKKILDIGAGYGRLMFELQSLEGDQKDVVGIDLVEEHIQEIKRQKPGSNVLVASWRNMPFADKSFEGGYVLGRSLLHEHDPKGMRAALYEMRRVLTDDGVLVIDTPNPEVGHYKKAREKYQNAAEKLGIVHYEQSAIIDSPNDENFFDRLAPSEEQFRSIAYLAGFNAEIIHKEKYGDNGGEKNENWYWRLTKREMWEFPEHIGDFSRDDWGEFQKLNEVDSKTRTGYPPIYVSWV